MMILLLTVAFAQDPQYTELLKGQPAPFAGYLLDHDGMDILTRQVKIGQQCPVEIDYQVSLMEARKKQEMDLMGSDYELEVIFLETEIEAQEERIAKLEKMKTPVSRGLWAAFGAALGVGTTIAIANAVN